MTKTIASKIVNVAVKSDEVSTPDHEEMMRVDLLGEQIPRRAEGELESVTVKESFFTQDGRQTIYFTISFTPMSGVVDGEAVTIERPMEIFLPVGQFTSNWAWMSSNMRLLSLLARAGDLPRALQEMRKVVWDKGPVRCGENAYGKPLYHDSDVAAIGWMIQQTLVRRGFLSAESLEPFDPATLASHYAARRRGEPVVVGADGNEAEEADADASFGSHSVGAAESRSVGECPECQGDLVLLDGCPTCVSGCGYSKC
jgi:ribonucleoside-diphosphate reductase alpha chain